MKIKEIMNTQEKTVWDFVEQHYPNYSTSEEIAENSDLQVLIDGQEEEGSKAWEIKQEIISDYSCVFPHHPYNEREEYRMKVADEIKNRYYESMSAIYEKAIEGYLIESERLKGNTISVSWSIEDISPTDDDGILIPLSDEEKREILARVKDNHDATIGINWEVLQSHTNDFLNERSK